VHLVVGDSRIVEPPPEPLASRPMATQRPTSFFNVLDIRTCAQSPGVFAHAKTDGVQKRRDAELLPASGAFVRTAEVPHILRKRRGPRQITRLRGDSVIGAFVTGDLAGSKPPSFPACAAGDRGWLPRFNLSGYGKSGYVGPAEHVRLVDPAALLLEPRPQAPSSRCGFWR